MKTSLMMAGLLSALFLCSCSPAIYLSKPENIDVNRYGSYIKVVRTAGANIKGELIAVDSTKLVILETLSKGIVLSFVPVGEIKRFKLRYAKPRNYGWSIPVFAAATISHGWFAIISLPVNIMVTSIVTATGATAFTSKNRDISYRDLSMFARFPQGIPPGIDLSTLK
jgi:hypothetical protein